MSLKDVILSVGTRYLSGLNYLSILVPRVVLTSRETLSLLDVFLRVGTRYFSSLNYQSNLVPRVVLTSRETLSLLDGFLRDAFKKKNLDIW